MLHQSLIIALVVVVVVLLAYWAYHACKLDRYLPAKHQKCSGSGAGSFRPSAHCTQHVGTNWPHNPCSYL